MDSDGSITHWIHKLQEGDAGAAQQELWNRYFHRLMALARIKLGESPRRSEDEEDVVISALHSFFDRAQRGNFPQLSDRSGLWPLLVKITVRKAINQRARQLAQKRGQGKTRGDSVFTNFNDDSQVIGIAQVIGQEPTPVFAAEVNEECGRLLGSLDGSLRKIAELKLQGYTNAEIANKLDVVERTVERKLKRIRNEWNKP